MADAPFDPFATGDAVAVAEPFDPFASGLADPQATNWATMFAGKDGLLRLSDVDHSAYRLLAENTDNTPEDHAQALNLAYLHSKAPEVDVPTMQANWPAVKLAFAQSALGWRDGDLSDGQLAKLISQHEEMTVKERFARSSALERLKMFFGSHGYGDNAIEGATPVIGSEAASTEGGLFTIPKAEGTGTMAGLMNASNKLVAGLTTPENVGLAAVTGGAGAVAELANATRVAVAARATQAAALGTFTAIGAKDTVEAVREARITVQNPQATDADKADAIATAVLSGAMTALAAKGTYDFAIKAKAEGAAPTNSTDIGAPKPSEPIAKNEDGSYKVTSPDGAITLDGLTEQQAQAASDALANAKDPIEALTSLAEAVKGDGKARPEPATGAPAPEVTPTPAETQPTPDVVESAGKAVVGIKNAAVDAELAEMGREPATHGEKVTFEQARADAAAKIEADPLAGQKLVAALDANPRPVTGKENALLLHEMTRLTIERNAAEKAFMEAVQNGAPDAIAEAKLRVQQAGDAYAKAADVDTRVGTENAIGLALRRMLMKEDYSLAAMEQRLRVANEGKPVSEAQAAEVRDLYNRLTEAERKLQEYTKARAARQPGKVAKTLSQHADEARQRIRERLTSGQLNSGIDPAMLKDYAIVGADLLAKGATKFADWSEQMIKELGDLVRPHLESLFAEAAKVKSEQARLEAMKTRTANATADMKRQLAKGEAEPKHKPEPIHLDPEANRLKAEYDLTRQEYDHLVERTRYENSSAMSKAAQQGLGMYDAARLLMTTGEFSFILRQGKVAVLSHPMQTAKALPATFRAFLEDPTGAHAINLEVLNHPDAPRARAAKLHIVDEGASLTKTEEILIGKIFGEKVPIIGKLVTRFNQAATVFLNRIRFDTFQTMRKIGLTAAEEKQLAMFVNEATGRGGLGSLEGAAVPLARVMFSPRYFASRLQLVAGHSLWGGTWATRRIIATEYAKTLVGLGAYYSLLYMALQAGTNKDVEIGDDPRSSDFGKVKIGNTRLDPLAGVAQVAVFAARSASGEKTTTTGRTHPIRGENVPYGSDKWSDVAANFARSKLHPVPSAIVNLFDGTDLAGHEADIGNQSLNMVAPLTYQDVYQALEEQDLPAGVALGLLAMLGEGLQTYSDKPSRKH